MKEQDAESLAGVLAQCPGLAHLDLSGNYHFGAAGAERLAGGLGQCPALVHLNLRQSDRRCRRREASNILAWSSFWPSV
jgi:Ran GTPase-activating protein (RanGAP) involved in mRNA processing and transport